MEQQPDSMDVSVPKLTHFDDSGRPKIVDVTDKEDTHRTAMATCII